MERIKFYSMDDLSVNYYISKIIDYLNKLNIVKSYQNDINTILEFYNIVKYKQLKSLQFDNICSGKINYIYKEINAFLKTKLNENNFKIFYKKIKDDYVENFWELLDKHIANLAFSNDIIKYVFRYKKSHIYYILKCKNIVDLYEKCFKKILLKYDITAELLIDKYEVIHDLCYKPFYFPSFDDDDIDKIFVRYINYENSNLNYLQVIPDITSAKLILKDEVKLLALKKVRSQQKLMFSEKACFKFGVNVKIDNFNKPSENYQNGIITYEIDASWIKENLDYPTLLNNFIYLFNFVDMQMRFVNFSKKSEFGLLEKMLELHTKFEYAIGMSYRIKQMSVSLQMLAYTKELKKYNVSIEKCLSWFYENYLSNEFGIKDFLVYMPNDTTTYFEKCRLIFPEIESILKQFELYQEHSSIDHDLIEISSKPIIFENVKSLNKKKYIYPNMENLFKLNFLLFSDQCMLHYLPKHEKYLTFFDLIVKEVVKYSDFEKYQQEDLDWLLDNKFIKKDGTGVIRFKDINKILILHDLYKNEFLSYHYYQKSDQKIIDNLIKHKLCHFEDTLFSKQEIEYLNFYLNNRSVSNGLSIRNRYGHGTQPRKDKEELHIQNYNYLLYVIVLITIKINDDLCIFDDITTERNSADLRKYRK